MSKFLRMIDGKLKPLDEREGGSDLGKTDPEPDDNKSAILMSDESECDEGFLARVDAKLKEAPNWKCSKCKIPMVNGECPECGEFITVPGSGDKADYGDDVCNDETCPMNQGTDLAHFKSDHKNESKLREGSSSEDSGSESGGKPAVAQAEPAGQSGGSSGSSDSGSSDSGSSESGSGSEAGSSEAEVNGKQFMEVMRRIFDNGTTIVAVTKHLAKTAQHYGADEHPEVVKAVHEILKASSTVAYNLAQLNSKLDKYVKKG